MKLTGNSLEQFEKWYQECYDKENLPYIQGFYASSFSIQYGVLVDWFDSMEIKIEIVESTENKWKGYINKEFKGVGYDSRPQAREKAIELANVIYNKK